ncbi:transposable element Tcb1 transposase [Trichonephila clavipes]|nr:transposable element Tcb1 transposase [Trichonephila clavipes]
MQIVTPKRLATAAKVTAELNQHSDSPVSMITVKRHLHKQNIFGRAAIHKPLVTEDDAKRHLQWCHTHKTWSIDKWIWSDAVAHRNFSRGSRVESSPILYHAPFHFADFRE